MGFSLAECPSGYHPSATPVRKAEPFTRVGFRVTSTSSAKVNLLTCNAGQL